jgi:hypothetical protein
MTSSYTYRHGYKDDYVYPSLKGINQLSKEYPDDWFLNNILRMIVHEKLLAEDKND